MGARAAGRGPPPAAGSSGAHVAVRAICPGFNVIVLTRQDQCSNPRAGIVLELVAMPVRTAWGSTGLTGSRFASVSSLCEGSGKSEPVEFAH